MDDIGEEAVVEVEFFQHLLQTKIFKYIPRACPIWFGSLVTLVELCLHPSLLLRRPRCNLAWQKLRKLQSFEYRKKKYVI